MTDKVIIDYTQCKYNTFDGGGSQRTICRLDGKYCDCLRDKECYYKQLQRKTQECEKLKAEMKQIKKDLRKRFSVQNVSDGEITCSKKQTCYAHLHAYEAMSAYCRADKKRAKYKSALEEIEEFCLVYRDNPVEGSAYKKILDIITKEKEQE